MSGTGTAPWFLLITLLEQLVHARTKGTQVAHVLKRRGYVQATGGVTVMCTSSQAR
jgi:hypothetical protein